MSRINTNIASMSAITKLVANNGDLTKRLQRLSSGLRINAGKDDPAGLIASENLRSEIAGLQGGIANSTRASSVISTAEGALNEVSALLIDIKGLLVATASKGGLSTEEIDANQMQLDSAINSIERIANSTEFEGKKLLNGTLAYSHTTTSGAANLDEVTINAAKLIDGAAMTVAIDVTTPAEQGVITVLTAATTVQYTVQVSSNRGTTELTFASGTSVADMETAINAVTEITGVTANTTDHKLYSVDYGSDASVTLSLTSGASGNGIVAGTDAGVDVAATVNGVAATGTGAVLKVRTSMLDVEVDLTDGGGDAGFTIDSGGADFAIGASVDAIGMESIGIPNIAPGQLGDATNGYLSSLKSGMTNALTSTNLYTAQRIVDKAIKEVSVLRGRLGAFQKNILETNINSLNIALENVTASESVIRDADFATETAALTRAQILVQANTSILSLANAMPQSVLALLG